MIAVRRSLPALAWTISLCCGAVGTTLLNPPAAAGMFAGLALTLYAGRAALILLRAAVTGEPVGGRGDPANLGTVPATATPVTGRKAFDVTEWARCTTGSYRLIGGHPRPRRAAGVPPVVAAQAGEEPPPVCRCQAWRLVERMQHGDTRAVGEFYDRFNVDVYRYVWLWCGDETLAQKLTREVWERALRSIGGLHANNDTPLSWLLRLARARAGQYFRTRRYRLGLIDLAAVQAVEALAFDDDHAQSAALLAAVRRLSPAQQEAIALTYFCGLDEIDSAAVMGNTPAIVQALTWQGRVRLAGLLAAGASA